MRRWRDERPQLAGMRHAGQTRAPPDQNYDWCTNEILLTVCCTGTHCAAVHGGAGVSVTGDNAHQRARRRHGHAEDRHGAESTRKVVPLMTRRASETGEALQIQAVSARQQAAVRMLQLRNQETAFRSKIYISRWPYKLDARQPRASRIPFPPPHAQLKSVLRPGSSCLPLRR